MKIQLDPRYKDIVLTKLINTLMKNGKKSIAEKAVYKTLELIKTKYNKSPLPILKEAIENIKPSVEVKTIKKHGKEYRIPCEINTKRQQSLGIRWIVKSLKKSSEKGLKFKLFNEIMNALNKKGLAYKMKDDMHQQAEKNRSNIHYRW
uniref:Ribosomal protein S7 n=1 Tax=Malawimonas californiana TaxID=221722 RepID=A0A0B5GFT6_MALCL|nr:ribosomal protein S7 [Malawimonas californiana]AJF22872.1 ribosomal protein S7 [Malawimonas californiana]